MSTKVIAEFFGQSGHGDAVAKLLLDVMGESLTFEGCEDIRILHDQNEPDHVTGLTQWTEATTTREPRITPIGNPTLNPSEDQHCQRAPSGGRASSEGPRGPRLAPHRRQAAAPATTGDRRRHTRAVRAIGQRAASAAGRWSARRCRSAIAWSSATRRW
jgi:hypothetical protein